MTHFKEAEPCWHCGHPAEHSLFCHYCDSLQRPTTDYYRFLGIDPKLTIDSRSLEKRFYDLSRLLHPDRYTRKGSTERQFSLEATAILNDAYRVLRDPVSRAEYVLRQSGFQTEEPRAKNVDPDLLEEVFELNMALEELRTGDDSARPQLEEARRRFLGLRNEADGQLAGLFGRYDEDRSREALEQIRKVLDRRKYIHNLVTEVEKALAA
ncbi:MAG: Fe-S protein assembly co-chaperone HscB [Bryobacteraceae bacterium]|nr:Fe-S protein assembly co-chaperone HscB [Bryobacteraceae bacterium]